jgi:hypothetical protein
MKIVNASTGKLSTCYTGPKHYLNEYIRLGEVALCIARDARRPARPFVWIIGGREQLIDYVSLAREKGELEDVDANLCLARLDEAKKKSPQTAMERLASALGVEADELTELVNVAQVCISAPVEGIKDFSTSKPVWAPKQTYASIH